VIGGLSDAALRRAQRRGDGWYGFALDPDATASVLGRLAQLGEHVGRTGPPLEITITPPPGAFSEETIARYAELGVDRLVPIGLGRDGDALLASLEGFAETFARHR
jgi:alkanesulfonate monooxygenase SsuD/methylene tetrahydromethanopterin reductase-like flavin-dependent oxidoreductase (luciferase family)